LNPYALSAGLLTTISFTLLGAIFLALKAEDPIKTRAQNLALRLWIPSVVILIAVIGFTYSQTDILTKLGVNPGVIPIGAVLASLITGYFIYRKQFGWAFILDSLASALTVITVFMLLYPRVMVSSLNPEWSLTIFNTSSSPYTLQVMTIVAVIFVPIVLVYQGWTYWVFRKRVSNNPEKLVY
jgi:cytochrome d ubiquinol oxidase subunit II